MPNKWYYGFKVEVDYDTVYYFRFLDDIVEYYEIEDMNEIQKVVIYSGQEKIDRTDYVLKLLKDKKDAK